MEGGRVAELEGVLEFGKGLEAGWRRLGTDRVRGWRGLGTWKEDGE